MSELRRRHPYEFFTRGKTIRANIESVKRHRRDYTADYPADSFVLPGAVQDWLDTEFAQEVGVLGLTVGLPRPPSIAFAARPHSVAALLLIVCDSNYLVFLFSLGKRRPTPLPPPRRAKQAWQNGVGAVVR